MTADLTRSDHLPTPEALDNGVTDTTALEIELIKAAFGNSLEVVLAAIGMSSLASRRDLDELASRLQRLFER